MRTKKKFGSFRRFYGNPMRLLMVLTILCSTISTQFTSVNAATMVNSRVESARMLNETRLDDEGEDDTTSQGDEQENPTEEPPEEPTVEPTATPTEDTGQAPIDTPAETPTEEPSAEPTLESTAFPECYVLTLDHEGEGSDLLAEPLNSIGCIEGSYLEGEMISLTGAVPEDGWEIAGWSGTADDTSMTDSNLLVMPAEDHAASVIYNEITMKALSDEGEVSAQTTYDWVAYNDCVYASGQHQGTNVTTITLSGSGTLVDQATGTSTGVTAEITYSGSGVATETYGDDTAEGTDAYITFYDYVDLTGDIRYGNSLGWYVDVTFTGLDSSKTYTFATTANRNGTGSSTPAYDERDSLFTIAGIDDATNESTEGTTMTATTTILCTGYNYDDGYVARWTGIQPGTDGEFYVRVESNSSSYRQAYGPSVFMLAEEEGTTTPTITTSGALTAFNTPAGTSSAEQSYTVEGSSLTDAIVITAPADFEISTTSGSDFTSTISLIPDSGIVTSTPIYVRYAPAASGTTSDNIAHTSTGATTQNVAVSGSSIPVITVTDGLTAFSSAVGVASEEQSYTVSAINLTENLVISAPANFEIAETSAGTFGSSLTLTPVSGVLTETPVYVRMNASAAGTFNENITHNSSGATEASVAVTGTAGYPTITVIGTLDAFSSEAGSASDEQSYTVTGNFLVDDITIAAPANFYISTTSGSGFGSTLTLTSTSGAVAETPIYVYFLKSSVGTSTGNIAHTSSSATEVDLAVSGTALAEAPWIAYNDCSWGSGQPDTNITTFNCYDGDDGELIKYSDGTNTGITVTITSSGLSNQASDSYSSEADPGTDAYETFYGIASILWGAKFNSGTSGYVDLVFSGLDSNKTYTFASTANRNKSTYTSRLTTFQLIDAITATNESTEGVTVTTTDFTDDTSTFCTGYNTVNGYVARWTGIQPSSSGTFTVKATSSTEASIPAVFLLAEEAGTVVPTITTSGELTTFSAAVGSPSTEQSYTVEGSSLTDDISISAPEGFELSTDNSNYYPALTLTQSDGSVSATTIYVRLASSAEEGDFGGNIEHSSSGAITENIEVGGSVRYVYTLTVDDDGNGSVTLDPSGGSYVNGTVVTLTPEPASGYRFVAWSGDNSTDVNETGGVYTIVVNGHKSLFANFKPLPEYSLTIEISPEGAGSVTVDPATGPYYEGDELILTAAPASGYEFGNWSGHLSGTTNPETLTMDGDKFITAVFTVEQTCTTVNLEAVNDLYMSSYNTTNNYGVSTTLKTTLSSSSSTKHASLFKWDLSSIPSDATVTDASLSLYVSSSAAASFYLYAMRQSWLEGTGASEETGDGATWLTYDGTNSWGENGAASTSLDRYDTNLWEADSTSFASTGSATVALNASGIGVLQDWIDQSLNNNGLTIQNYDSSSTSYTLQIASLENTSYSGPTLNITYCTGGTPTYALTITTSGDGSVTIDPDQTSYEEGAEVALTPVPGEGYEFSLWNGENGSDPNDNGDGTWSLIMDSDKMLEAVFAEIPVNVAPELPVLVSPEDEAVGVLTSPTLEVTVSDSNPSDTLDVSFYGRATGSSSGEDFSLVVIPDPQNLTQYYPAVLTSQFTWMVNNASAENIVFITTVGDLVNTASSTTQYETIDAAYDLIDAAGIPYSVGPGNHDSPATNYNIYFGTSRFSGKSWYQGAYSSSNENNYSFFSASGNDFILINLQYNPTTDMLNWADALLKANPDRRGIVESHSILNIDNSWKNQDIYTALKDNPNLFLLLCGHMHSSTDGSAYRSELGDDGHTIHIMLADYQDINDGYLRLLRFSPVDDKIYGTTYSPYTGSYLNSTTNYDQTELAYDMDNGNTTFELLGTVEDVANGSNASITWDDLTNSTEYEWYATVSDGTETVTGSTWSFTTEAAGTNHAPVLDPISDQEVDELSPLSFTATADDVDGNPLYFSLDNGTSGEVPSGASIGSSSGVFSWTPSEAQGAGDYTFDVCVSDGSLSDCQTIRVTVNEVNNAPELSPIGDKGVDELVTLSFIAVAIDGDDDPVTYSLADGTSGSVPTGAAIGSTSGSFTWTPTEEQGPDSYTFDVCASDSVFNDCETITVTVNEANTAPVLAFISDKNVVEENELTFTASAADGDFPVNTLTYALTGTVPAGASIHASSGVFSWTPDSTQGGSNYIFAIEVCDDGDPSLCDDQEITVTVEDHNVAPEAFDDNYETNEDTQLEVSSILGVLANDEDDDEDELNAIKESDPQHGNLIFNTDGSFTYTPTGDYNGTDSFTYKANDGVLDSNIATVSLNIISINDDPVITEGASVDVNMSKNSLPIAFALTLHASDADTSDTLSWSIATPASHGTAGASGTGTSQVVEYTPTTDYVGDDSFVVEVADGHAGMDSITVNVHISEVLYTISGNAGVAGATLTYTGGSTVAESSGDYSISVPYDWSGTVTPSLSGYIFTPENRSYSNVVADINGEDYAAVPVESQDIALVEGWNLISFRIAPTSTLIEDVLASIEGNYSLVYAWDAGDEENSWLKYDPTGAGFVNTLFNLDECMGFWINMTAADTLTVTGTLPSSTDIELLDDAGGWNLVGYPSETSGTLPEILVDHGVGTDFSLIYTYEANDLVDPWKLYDRFGSGYANDLTSLAPGFGHWIKVSGDFTWNVAY